jgi:hypothetical protein
MNWRPVSLGKEYDAIVVGAIRASERSSGCFIHYSLALELHPQKDFPRDLVIPR